MTDITKEALTLLNAKACAKIADGYSLGADEVAELLDVIKAQGVRVGELEAHFLRLHDGVEAISQYGSDTRVGPSSGPKDAQWYADGLAEMLNRANRLIWGNTWEEPIDQWAPDESNRIKVHIAALKGPTNG